MLYINVFKAQNLAAAKSNRLSDPFLKMQLLQGKCKYLKWKSMIKQNTLNPSFYNNFVFTVKEFSLSLFTLYFSVWNKEDQGKNKFLGQIKIKLSKSIVSESPQWFNFVGDSETCVNEISEVGQLSLSLKFQVKEFIGATALGKLVVGVKSAKGLPKRQGQEHYLGNYVSLYLLSAKASQSHEQDVRQSNVVQGDFNCVWNEEFEFNNITLEQLSNKFVLDITVWEETSLQESN